MKKAFFASNANKKALLPDNIILGISVGQEYHEKYKLAAAVELINTRFQSREVFLTIAVCDTLQRHSIAAIESLKKQEALQLSITRGAQWLERNRQTLSKINVPHQFLHWDHWLKSDAFDDCYQRIKEELNDNADFKSAMSESVDNFTKRTIEKNPSIDPECIKAASEEYLVEESAVLMLMWAKDYRFQHLYYPGDMTKVLTVAKALFVSAPDQLEWTKIRFKTAKQSKKDCVSNEKTGASVQDNKLTLSEHQASSFIEGFSSLLNNMIADNKGLSDETKSGLLNLHHMVMSHIIIASTTDEIVGDQCQASASVASIFGENVDKRRVITGSNHAAYSVKS